MTPAAPQQLMILHTQMQDHSLNCCLARRQWLVTLLIRGYPIQSWGSTVLPTCSLYRFTQPQQQKSIGLLQSPVPRPPRWLACTHHSMMMVATSSSFSKATTSPRSLAEQRQQNESETQHSDEVSTSSLIPRSSSTSSYTARSTISAAVWAPRQPCWFNIVAVIAVCIFAQ